MADLRVGNTRGGTAAVAADDSLRWGRAWRHPAVGVAVACCTAVVFLRLGVTPRGVIVGFLVAVLVLLSAIDVERRILPNAIVLPSAGLVLAAQVAFYPDRALEWTLAAVGASAVLFVLFIVNPAGMGLGDVKLALLLGAGLGGRVIPALVIGSLSVLPVGLYLLRREGAGARKSAIPFGPFLAFGAIVAVLMG